MSGSIINAFYTSHMSAPTLDSRDYFNHAPTVSRIPVAHSATVEIGTGCPLTCSGCGFSHEAQEDPDQDVANIPDMNGPEMVQTIDELSAFWQHAIDHPEQFQVIGNRIIEFLGASGLMNKLTSEEFRAIARAACANNLAHIAFLADGSLDRNGIKKFFEEHARVVAENDSENGSDTKAIVALSGDALPGAKDGNDSRRGKANSMWRMLERKNRYIKDPDRQNFRVFSVLTKDNVRDMAAIARKVLETGSLLFIAPMTAHPPESLEGDAVSSRLILGTDQEAVDSLLTEADIDDVTALVTELRALKDEYPDAFLNGEGHFQNMLAVCQPVTEPFPGNCRRDVAFRTQEGEKLIATPNWRVRVKEIAGKTRELCLNICTGMVGPTDSPDNYANTSLGFLQQIVTGKATIADLYQRLTRDLLRKGGHCSCNFRTGLSIEGETVK